MRYYIGFLLGIVTLLRLVEMVSSTVHLQRNGYTGVIIAINPEVEENPLLIEAIKNSWRNASRDLFRASRNRAYYKDVSIVVPATWTTRKYPHGNGETYRKADVIVAQQNAAYGDMPYTLQFGKCGQPGSYIHLTPAYLLNDSFIDDHGPRGKTIVHEWAHYRWGVFDEIATNGYDPFYLASDGVARATTCTSIVRGQQFAVDWQSGTYGECRISSETSLPEDGCIFVPNEDNQPPASMMAHQYLNSVNTFCDDSDSANRHNSHAPNEQNRLCNLRSTWEVITSSEDFKAKRNSPNQNVNKTNPRFRIVQPLPQQRFVLVLDVSGSMDTNRLLMMKQAAATFLLQAVPHGSMVGLVEFSANATVLSGMSKINDYDDRLKLKDLLPKGAGGGTSIGSGILEALWLLEKSGTSRKATAIPPRCDVRKVSGKQCNKGGTIIVLSDGQENQYPSLEDIYKKIVDAGTVVHSIVFTEDADPMLQVISERTGGTWYFSDETKIHATSALSNAFVTAAKTNDGDGRQQTFQIHSSSFTLTSDSPQSGRIIVDRTVGSNTIVTFTWSQYDSPPDIVLQPPRGCTFSIIPRPLTACDPDYRPDIDYKLKMIIFHINEDAEVGRWLYNVTRMSPYFQKVVVTATTMPLTKISNKITVESGMGKVAAGHGEAIVIYARVQTGFVPVLGAHVVATVEKPTGETVVINLQDEGAAPDIRKEDGVYSKYFFDYSGPGRYSVQITVTGVHGITKTSKSISQPTAALRFGFLRGNGLKLNKNGALTSSSKSTETGEFQRFTSAGAFSYNGSKISQDILPPAQIYDLKAFRNGRSNIAPVRISFTAPGDDYDVGTAKMYDIRYTFDDPAVLRDRFDECQQIEPDMVQRSSISAPQEAGIREIFNIEVKSITPNESRIILSMALRAIDDAGNRGEVSNVVILALSRRTNGNIKGASMEYILMIAFMCTTGVLAVIIIILVPTFFRMRRKYMKTHK